MNASSPPRLLTRWKKRLRALFQTADVDRELDEELAFHLAMETEKNVKNGMTPQEAKRQAKLAFGAVEKARAETRESRWWSWFPDLSLDFKLGGRMLIKYPGLTLVGGLAIAFGIWVGAVTFAMTSMLLSPDIALPNADRLVQMRLYDLKGSQTEQRVLYDFQRWKTGLRSITDLGAHIDQTRNLVVSPGNAQPVVMAEISASAFRLAPEPPLLGRVLVEADERVGAPQVAVLGYDVWQTRFAGDSGVLGRSVQVGRDYATIVGVMRKGFAFPTSHELWMPLRIDGSVAPRTGASVQLFGRLADGASIEQAHTELTTYVRREAVENRTTHERLLPQIVQFGFPFESPNNPQNLVLMMAIPGFAIMLLVLVCGNVALLLFARAASRESELVVRSALGASRARIILQLFAEALVLGSISAAIGLALADVSLRRWGTVFLQENLGRLPFWYDPSVSATTVFYTAGLTLLAAIIAGVLPGLKVTKGLGARLRASGTGAGGLRFGGIWTAVIVSQVAVTTAFPAMVFLENFALTRVQTSDPGFPAEQYLGVLVEAGTEFSRDWTDDERIAEGRRFISSVEALRARVAGLPGVVGVTFVDRVPRESHRQRLFELDSDVDKSIDRSAPVAPAGKEPFRESHLAFVDHTYFDVLEAPILSGRDFGVADLKSNPDVIIVDQGFVDQVLQGRNAIGRRIRFIDWKARENGTTPNEPWMQIVGVVKELGVGAPTEMGRAAGVYLPTVPGDQGPVNLIVHTRGDPLSIVGDLRTAAATVDPTLRLSTFQRLDQVTSGIIWVVMLWLRLTLLLTAVALLLSLAGIYSVMSFTVARRTREIGIRVALGANARKVVAAIFRRPIIQVASGVAIGGVIASTFLLFITRCQDGVCQSLDGAITPYRVAMLLLYLSIVLTVCLLACVVPTRRALAVEPVEALRSE